MGDAAAEDVAAGKTFTSAAGLNVTGTAVVFPSKFIKGIESGSKTLVSSSSYVQRETFSKTSSYIMHCNYEYSATLEEAGLSNADFFEISASGHISYRYYNSKGTQLNTTTEVTPTVTVENGIVYVRMKQDVELTSTYGVAGPAELYIAVTATVYTITEFK